MYSQTKERNNAILLSYLRTMSIQMKFRYIMDSEQI